MYLSSKPISTPPHGDEAFVQVLVFAFAVKTTFAIRTSFDRTKYPLQPQMSDIAHVW